MEWFMELNPIAQGLSATIFTWAITALGAALVFFFKTVDRRILNCMLGWSWSYDSSKFLVIIKSSNRIM